MKLSAHQTLSREAFDGVYLQKEKWIHLRGKTEKGIRNHYTSAFYSFFDADESCLFSRHYLWEINNISNDANVFFALLRFQKI